ncbi:hypothetical protein RIR_jg6141.t1 [Rhizophagus irregularis DAOM 181602=DAOM 197198]|nr:hypothetical protein RIR_jg6141.t1 [Rhizophagus irregularis DAOM 181602=DAOM 197198]
MVGVILLKIADNDCAYVIDKIGLTFRVFIYRDFVRYQLLSNDPTCISPNMKQKLDQKILVYQLKYNLFCKIHNNLYL